RAEITKKVISFTANSEKFMEDFKGAQDKLKQQIANAKKILNDVYIPDKFYEQVSKLITELNIISHRADIVFVRCARAHAALNGRKHVNKDDFKIAFDLALGHRLKNISLLGEQEKDISDRILDIYGKIEEAIEDEDLYQPSELNQEGPLKYSDKEQDTMEITPLRDEHPELPEPEEDQRTESDQDIPDDAYRGEGMRVGSIPRNEILNIESKDQVKRTKRKVVDILKILHEQKLHSSGRSKGKRIKITSRDRGRYVTFRNPPPRSRPKSVAIDATIRYALMESCLRDDSELKPSLKSQHFDHLDGDGEIASTSTPVVATTMTGETRYRAAVPLPLAIPRSVIKEKVFEYRSPLTLYFVLDASASMANTLQQMYQVIDSLHLEGYKKKDKVAVVMFRGKQAHVIQKPSINLETISKKLASIRGTSYTPLAEGISKVLNMIKLERIKDPNSIPVMIIVSDCGANISRKYPTLVAQVHEDYKIIVEEMNEIAEKISKIQNLKTIIVMPKKSYAMRNVGINPFVQMQILKIMKEKAGAIVFEFAGLDATNIFLKELL
ncbi:MAG: VWA domain-containing protein, partial [Promethearchaeota archaeon]